MRVKNKTNKERRGILTIAKLDQFPAVAGVVDEEKYLMKVMKKAQLQKPQETAPGVSKT